MKSIETLFANFFDDKNITGYRLRQFAEESLQKLIKANTGGQYDAVIAELTAAIQAIGNYQKQMLTDIARQKGSTYTTNEVMEAFLNEVRIQRGVIREKYRNHEQTFLLFYPQGMKEFNRSRSKSKIYFLMKQFADAVQKHAADFPPSTVTLFANFPVAFKTAQDDQYSRMGSVSKNRVSLHQTRQALNEAVYVAVFTAGAMERGNISRLKGLFNFSLLLPHSHRAPKEKYQGSISPDQTVIAVHDTFPEGTRIRFRNHGKYELKIGSCATGEPSPDMVWQTLKPGMTKTYKIAKLLSHPDHTYILISNPDLNDLGFWQIERWVE